MRSGARPEYRARIYDSLCEFERLWSDACMKIRDATNHDLARIMEIERLAFESPWTVDSFTRELSLPFSRVIVANIEIDFEGRLAGCLCRWLVADECHILN